MAHRGEEKAFAFTGGFRSILGSLEFGGMVLLLCDINACGDDELRFTGRIANEGEFEVRKDDPAIAEKMTFLHASLIPLAMKQLEELLPVTLAIVGMC